MQNITSPNSERKSISLAAVIAIFMIFFLGFVGVISFLGYYYILPKVAELRNRSQATQSETNPQSSADPQAAIKKQKKQAFIQANTQISELWKEEKYKEATVSAKALLDNATSDDDLANAYTWNGYVLMRNNHSKDAEAELKKAIALKSEYTEAYLGLDEIYYTRKDYRSMLANADKVLSYNPNSSTFHNERGVALDGLNRLNEAIAEYKKAVELDATNQVAKDNLKRSQQ